MSEQEVDNAGRWINIRFCNYCGEGDNLCECLDHHIQAVKDIGFSDYEEAEDSFEWEGYRGDLKDWAQELCEDIYYQELEALPAFIVNTIDWDWVAQQLMMDYYQIEDKDTKGYIYIYRQC